MTLLVSSKSSPILSVASQKEALTTVGLNNNHDNSLLRHYSLLASSILIEEDSLIESLPSLYFNEDDKKEDTEEDDTEDDDEYTTSKEQKMPPAADHINVSSCLIKKAAPLFPTSSSASCSSSQLPQPIQTYSPQLNLSLYSPSPSVASSIRSTKKSRSSHHSYSLASSAASPSSNRFSCTAAASSASYTAARNPTLTSFNNIKRSEPLYSTTTSSSSIASTIKMDIRSPPQPSQSTSRFMNAFHRFRNAGSSSSSATTSALFNNNNQKNALYHQNTTNSVAPAEIISTMKPSPSKSSLADKIKSKFHQQLDKKKNRASLVELSTKKRALSNFSMPRSASLSSMTNWSSRLSGGGNNAKSTPLKKGINVNNDKIKLSHSASISSRLSISSSLSSSISSSSTSSSTHGDTSLFMPPEIATSNPTTTATSSAFSLTKSISSHRLYSKSSSEASSSNSDAGSRNSHQATRPRQPLRAVNPNDSVRLITRQSSPKTSSNNNRKSSAQQQQQSQNTIVRFTKLVSVRETFSKNDYDRGSDPDAVCTRLTPAMAQQIKEELNAYKLHEMQVHEYSRVHTHFFL